MLVAGETARISLEETTALMKNLQVKNGNAGYVAARIALIGESDLERGLLREGFLNHRLSREGGKDG
jgi:hypothetical protein